MSNSVVRSGGQSIAFVDAAIAHSQSLIEGLKPGTEVVILDPNQDGILQMSAVLNGRLGIDSVHIFSHGEMGGLQLGSTRLNGDSLTQYSSQLQQWSASLSSQADILLYGCNVAAGAQGAAFVQQLSELTGADVAASTNLTGRGGDWMLESRTGVIESGSALSAQAMAQYGGTLNIVTVTTTADSGTGSLRWAIQNALPGSTIQFAANLANSTITLTSGGLTIPRGRNLTIDATTAPNLTISGNNQFRIFMVDSTSVQPTSLTLRNLTLSNGFTAERGGAIATTHQGVLNIENVRFFNNTANLGGGAIFSAFEGTVTVTNSRFEGNRATAGNDERGAGAIAFWGPRALTVRNSDFVNNHGINGGAINSLNGKLTIEDSRFIGNTTIAGVYATGRPNPYLRGFGGAVYADRASSTSEPSGFISIVRSTFENNQGRGEGGAAYLYTGRQDRVTIADTAFLYNTVLSLPNGGNAGNGGGLVVMSNETNQGLSINRSSFVGNVANNQGGGLWAMNSPATITNTTFSTNRTQMQPGNSNQNGGAMALYGPATITNSTIANNYAGWVGGGIMADSSPVSVRNTIFSNNTAGNGGNDWRIRQQTSRALTDLGGNIQSPGFLSNQFNRFNDNLATNSIALGDPRLGRLRSNGGFLWYHPLLPDSPAINAGVTTGAPTTDQKRSPREGAPDIGAVEALVGTAQNDTLTGTAGSDTMLGRGGNDLLTGGLEADFMAGGLGADRFLYRGGNQSEAFAGSLLLSLDTITDFNAVAGDRIQLDFDNNLSTPHLPGGLFNAGTVAGSNLSQAMAAAFADKNFQVAGAQSLAANEAVLFGWGGQIHLAVNDGNTALNTSRDLLIRVTGITLMPEHIGQGTLAVGSYFV